MILTQENRPEGRGNKNWEGKDEQRKWSGGVGWREEIKRNKENRGQGEDRIYRNEKHRMRKWNMAWNNGRRKMRGEDGWNRGWEETRNARWTNAIHLSSCPAAGEGLQCKWPCTNTQTHTDRESKRVSVSWWCRTLILQCRETEEGRVGEKQALLEGGKRRRRRNEGSSGEM